MSKTASERHKWTFNLSGDRLIAWIHVALNGQGVPPALAQGLVETVFARWKGKQLSVTIESQK